MGIYNILAGNDPAEIIAASRSLTTTRAINSNTNVIHRIDLEPLTFTLQLSPLNGSFTPELITKLYKWFDTDDYCKLSFDDETDFYYNVMPFTNQSEINLYIQNKGYFEVGFICDSGHGWIDISETITCEKGTSSTVSLHCNNSIMINGSYNVPLFLSLNFLGNGGESLSVLSSAASDIFTLKNIPSGCTRIDIDGTNGIMSNLTDNTNFYSLCENTDQLFLDSSATTKVTITNLSASASFTATIGASIPAMSGTSSENTNDSTIDDDDDNSTSNDYSGLIGTAELGGITDEGIMGELEEYK